MKRFFGKILCFFGKHTYNITDVTSVVYLECRYCDNEITSWQPSMYKRADIEKRIFEHENTLTRFVMIEKKVIIDSKTGQMKNVKFNRTSTEKRYHV